MGEVAATGPLEVAQAFFSSFDPSLLHGDLAQWERWDAASTRPDRWDMRRTVRRIEAVEETATRVVVDVHADIVAQIQGGTYEAKASVDGPAVIELIDGSWRVTDYTFEGRLRSEAVVVGPLAEQQNCGVTARVLGVDRAPDATEALVEVVNGSDEPIRVDHGLLLLGGVWRRIATVHDPIAPGETQIVQLTSGGSLALTQHAFSIGLRVRAGRRRLPFLLNTPLARPHEPFRSSPPRHLPLLQSSSHAMLFLAALATAAIAWFTGWFALSVPIFFVLVYWRHWRAIGALPARVQRFGGVFDVIVVGACIAAPWETPAAELAVPIAIGVASFLVLGLARVSANARVVIAISAASTWIALLGGPSDPLSPCRLAGGSPTATSDAFARAIFTGDQTAARRLETKRAHTYERFLPRRLHVADAARLVATRRDRTSTKLCGGLAAENVSRCYAYPGPNELLWVGVGCETHDWRVEVAL